MFTFIKTSCFNFIPTLAIRYQNLILFKSIQFGFEFLCFELEYEIIFNKASCSDCQFHSHDGRSHYCHCSNNMVESKPPVVTFDFDPNRKSKIDCCCKAFVKK